IRVVDQMTATGMDLDVQVVPGISAVQLLAARHRLVLNRIGEPVTVSTGRLLAQTVEQGGDNIVVMLDGSLACGRLADTGGWEIWWGANLGTDTEVLVHGRLDQVLADVRDARAAARQRCGWVMDTYLLRRSG